MSEPNVVIVTGAASGIGLGISRRFVRDGHAVAMLDVQEDALERESDALHAEGGRVLVRRVDVSRRTDIEAAYDAVRKAFGPIRIVIANAGIGGAQPVVSMSPETWQRMIDINLTGVFHTVQAALPDMIERKWGRIVTISSQAGQSGAPGRAHYAAAKAGVIGFTKSLARELAQHQITANTIPPSIVDTPLMRSESAAGQVMQPEMLARLVPLGRAGTPDDIAAACAFLCREEAAYITGQEINVNGGMYM